jgi:hypothetical protein
MGITELAHFLPPFLTDEPYSYFPGMASVLFLVPLPGGVYGDCLKKIPYPIHNETVNDRIMTASRQLTMPNKLKRI